MNYTEYVIMLNFYLVGYTFFIRGDSWGGGGRGGFIPPKIVYIPQENLQTGPLP